MAGYLYFASALLLITGILLVTTDYTLFKRKKMSREQKLSFVLGWINIGLSVALFSFNWAYYQWFW